MASICCLKKISRGATNTLPSLFFCHLATLRPSTEGCHCLSPQKARWPGGGIEAHRPKAKSSPSRWCNVKERRTAEIKTDSWWMSLDVYWQAKFAACLVRCDTFGPAGVATAAAAAVALVVAWLWNRLEEEKTGEEKKGAGDRRDQSVEWRKKIWEFVARKFRPRETINSKLYLRRRWLRTFHHIKSGCTRDVTNAVPASY